MKTRLTMMVCLVLMSMSLPVFAADIEAGKCYNFQTDAPLTIGVTDGVVSFSWSDLPLEEVDCDTAPPPPPPGPQVINYSIDGTSFTWNASWAAICQIDGRSVPTTGSRDMAPGDHDMACGNDSSDRQDISFTIEGGEPPPPPPPPPPGPVEPGEYVGWDGVKITGGSKSCVPTTVSEFWDCVRGGDAHITFASDFVIPRFEQYGMENITIDGAGYDVDISQGMVWGDCNNVILRNLRGADTKNKDTLSIDGCDNMLIEHVTAHEAADECIAVSNSGAKNVLINNSLIHDCSKGMLTKYQNLDGVSMNGNLFYNNRERSPQACAVPGTTLRMEMINNVVIDWFYQGTRLCDTQGQTTGNMINNFYDGGERNAVALEIYDGSRGNPNAVMPLLYMEGNRIPSENRWKHTNQVGKYQGTSYEVRTLEQVRADLQNVGAPFKTAADQAAIDAAIARMMAE